MSGLRRLAVGAVALAMIGGARGGDADDLAHFEKRIRPALLEHCVECHGADVTEAGLRLDARAGWEKGGDSGPAIAPHKPAESLLLKAIRYSDADLQMPPTGKLPDSVIADFSRWIERGAVDPREAGADASPARRVPSIEDGRRHWAYQLPKRSPAPEPHNAGWPTNDIDRFLLTRMESEGLAPTRDAPPASLIRRLYFDLIGLPPTPQQLEAFERDPSPAAYERRVDELLASPHFGERWGRHWLDVARFGESVTLRGLIFRNAWRYRDYVIEAYRADRPFDQMIRDQIAGDLYATGDVEERRRQAIATTYLALANANFEEQDKTQLRMDVVDEQLDVIGRGFLAQTIGCARCHDHKFDPIPTRDYYALAGILRNCKSLENANVSRWVELPLPEPPETVAARRRQESLIREQELLIASERQRVKELGGAGPDKGVVQANQLPGVVIDDAQATKVGAWTVSTSVKPYVGAGYVHDDNQEKGKKSLTFTPEFSKDGKYEVRLAYTASGNRATNVPVTIFSADGEFTRAVDERQPPTIEGRWVSLGSYAFVKNGQGFVLIGTEATDGHVVADALQFLPADAPSVDVATPPKAERSREHADARARIRELEKKVDALKKEVPPSELAMTVGEEPTIEDARIHARGSARALGERVPRGVLQVATFGEPAPMPTDESGRRQLAEWIASPRNPLTARVYVNRVWGWLFGAGLSRTPDNFGLTGEPPTHPELLDFLTLKFIDEGWSTKRLVRTIVLSHAYRQSTFAEERTRQADPDNRLWTRYRRRPLDAECLRDAMLAISGELSLERGGPTIPEKLAEDYGYVSDSTRRAVYLPALRNSLPEIVATFDGADPSVVTGQRTESAVATQALFLMNHPFVHDRAKAAARRLIADAGDDDGRITLAFRRSLGRSPTPTERAAVLEFLKAEPAPSDEDRESAWTRIAQSLFSSIDFRYLVDAP